ncbi:serine acetyltransferase [Bradyrhizobium sp. SSBR45G]|uniref:serine O-acetyltransferase n=1 Tax=unclassified Bradyrhizobium TaxID=2631580 RepID=UPI002342A9F0|nr:MULTISPECIES: serine acetyltransferase [unclassified Bradyrhizobium]GLH80648.1 serine acetyltransferase [Bradyrhizobium sp. SSBR45G]GLH85854.1 serine acetyltransferase [Bradyrhizobium sp. SSBR45R]
MAVTRASRTELWPSLRHEAQLAAARDPAFGQALSAAILEHPDLGSVVAHQIGVRLGSGAAARARFAAIAREAQTTSPALVAAAYSDLAAIAAHDPATTALLPPLLNYKGYIALQAYRLAHWLWSNRQPDLALLLQAESSTSLQVSIHPSARIGTSVFLDHATGIVIGAFSSIGDDVTIMQNVTIGRLDAMPGRGPRIGRGVLLSSGATVLGDVRIGDDAKIGADAIVTTDVPAGCTAVGTPTRLTNCPGQPLPAGA